MDDHNQILEKYYDNFIRIKTFTTEPLRKNYTFKILESISKILKSTF